MTTPSITITTSNIPEANATLGRHGRLLSHPPSSRIQLQRSRSAQGYNPPSDPSQVTAGSPQHEFDSMRPRSQTIPLHSSRSDGVPRRQPPTPPDQNDAAGSDIKLSRFATLHSRQFPIRVKACKGFCSSSTEVSISHGEIFDLHFLKHTKVVKMRDSHGVDYSIPLNSTVTFGLVYDQYSNERMSIAVTPPLFSTVSDIMNQKKLPVVVCATKAYNGGNAENSVGEDEVLVVGGIRSTMRGRILKVFSLKHGKKYLHERCIGHFSTSPAKTCMLLSSMFQNSIPFPQKAMVFAGAEVAQALPAYLLKSPVTLKQCGIETSVVATCPLVNTSPESGQAIYMPISLDIEVEAVTLSDHEISQLQSTTRALYKKFDPGKLTPYVDMPSTVAYEVQCALYTSLQVQNKMYGEQVVRPDTLFEPEPLPSPELTLPGEQYDSLSDHLSEVSISTDIENHFKALEGQYNHLEGMVSNLSSQVSELTSKVEQLTTQVEHSSKFMQEMGSIDVSDKLMSWCGKMQDEIKEIQGSLAVLPPSTFTINEDDERTLL